jgi:hypothetical protein
MLPRPQRLMAFKNSVGFKTLGTGLQKPRPAAVIGENATPSGLIPLHGTH